MMMKLITGTILSLAVSTTAMAEPVQKVTLELEVACMKGEFSMEEWIMNLNEYYGEVPVFVGEENNKEGDPNDTHIVVTRSLPMKTFSILVGGKTGTCLITSGEVHGINDVPGHEPTKELPKKDEEPDVPFLFNNSDFKTFDS
jgi:hypothetical protein